jgi:hypothetical protein
LERGLCLFGLALILTRINRKKTDIMKIKNQYEYQIPTYAYYALMNDDLSYLPKEDQNNINQFHRINKNIDIWQDRWENQKAYFCANPAFGLPCDVVDLVGIEFEKEES